MYQSQQISTDLCIDFYILHMFHSVVDISLRSKLWISYVGGDKSVPCVALVMYFFRTSHRLAAHLYPVTPRTNSNRLYVSDFYVVFVTASFPQRRRHFTVQ
jgi:hypothetical protein